MYLFPFLHFKDQIFDTAKINLIISSELLTKEDDFTKEFFNIISSIIFYGFYENHNSNTLCISKSKNGLPLYIKQYLCKILPKIVVQENGYFLYC